MARDATCGPSQKPTSHRKTPRGDNGAGNAANNDDDEDNHAGPAHQEGDADDLAAASDGDEPELAVDAQEHACEVCVSRAIGRCRGAAPRWDLHCVPGPASRCATCVASKRCCEEQPALIAGNIRAVLRTVARCSELEQTLGRAEGAPPAFLLLGGELMNATLKLWRRHKALYGLRGGPAAPALLAPVALPEWERQPNFPCAGCFFGGFSWGSHRTPGLSLRAGPRACQCEMYWSDLWVRPLSTHPWVNGRGLCPSVARRCRSGGAVLGAVGGAPRASGLHLERRSQICTARRPRHARARQGVRPLGADTEFARPPDLPGVGVGRQGGPARRRRAPGGSGVAAFGARRPVLYPPRFRATMTDDAVEVPVWKWRAACRSRGASKVRACLEDAGLVALVGKNQFLQRESDRADVRTTTGSHH